MLSLPSRKAELAGFAGLTVLSFLLSRSGGMFLFFAVPLGLIYRLLGFRWFFPAAGAVLVLTVLLAGGENIEGALSSAAPFLGIRIGIPLILIAGLFFLLAGDLIPLRGVYRFLLFSGLLALGGLPLFIRLFENPEFQEYLKAQAAFMDSFFQSQDPGGFSGGLFFSDPEALAVFRETYLRSFVPVLGFLVLITWTLSEAVAARLLVRLGRGAGDKKGRRPISLAGFRTPLVLIWPVIGFGFLILVDIFFPLGTAGCLVWNGGLVLLLIYGIQGAGLIQFFLNRLRMHRFIQVCVFILLGALLFRPGIGSFLLILVPAFGLSEHWIRYR
ncbi:MAG: hypothetical protein LBQ61_09415 [Spirochaetales bacterium]|jgi:hypothetical protein|nr:hypothetical protein [Spirochaetales bacterium]